MRKMNLLITLTLSLTLVGVACACGMSSARVTAGEQGGQGTHQHDKSKGEVGEEMKTNFAVHEQEKKTFAVSGVTQVNVEDFEGPIVVRAWDRPEVSFTADKQAIDDQSMSGVRVEAQQRGSNILISAKFDKPQRVIKLSGILMHTNGAFVKLEVNVPRETNVRLRTGNGQLSLAGVSGDADLRTEHGPIDVNDGRGRVTAWTNNGLIRIANFEGEAEAREMGRNGISLDGSFAKLTAQTGGAPITLALPAGFDATLETDNGNVVNHGLDLTEEASPSRNVRRWRIGRGGNVLSLRTGNGQIILLRADNARASAGAK
ncbi:MAG: hypothetical protein WCB68_00825 [Pyrinomonadaceae bacterium]